MLRWLLVLLSVCIVTSKVNIEINNIINGRGGDRKEPSEPPTPTRPTHPPTTTKEYCMFAGERRALDSRWMQGCSVCTCSANGRVRCDDSDCPPDNVCSDSYGTLRPNQRVQRECKTCWCNEATMMIECDESACKRFSLEFAIAIEGTSDAAPGPVDLSRIAVVFGVPESNVRPLLPEFEATPQANKKATIQQVRGRWILRFEITDALMRTALKVIRDVIAGQMDSIPGVPGKIQTKFQFPDASSVTCGAGSVWDENGVCQLCPRGTSAPSGFNLILLSCRNCPAGSYAAQEGSPECTPCPRGTYAPSSNSDACMACPTANDEGMTTCPVAPPVDKEEWQVRVELSQTVSSCDSVQFTPSLIKTGLQIAGISVSDEDLVITEGDCTANVLKFTVALKGLSSEAEAQQWASSFRNSPILPTVLAQANAKIDEIFTEKISPVVVPPMDYQVRVELVQRVPDCDISFSPSLISAGLQAAGLGIDPADLRMVEGSCNPDTLQFKFSVIMINLPNKQAAEEFKSSIEGNALLPAVLGAAGVSLDDIIVEPEQQQ